jgi:hypothetical protein
VNQPVDERGRKIEALATAWASIDGKLAKFIACKNYPDLDATDGHYSGYYAEACEMLNRLELYGFTIVRKAVP